MAAIVSMCAFLLKINLPGFHTMQGVHPTPALAPAGLFVGCWGAYLLQTTEGDLKADLLEDPVASLQKCPGKRKLQRSFG